MKEWFPFTDYDFYGYLACGLVLLFAADYWHSGGHYLVHDQWTFFQGALTIALAYVAGQIIAMPSSIVLENGLARGWMRPPVKVLLSSRQGKVERFIGRFIIGRYYAPLPAGTRDKIFQNAEADTGLTNAQLMANVEEVFMPAYNAARRSEDTRKRMDDFRNQYGFNRNMALSGLIATVLMIDRAWRGGDSEAWNLAIFAFLLSAGMLARFLKFYSCFAAEVLRAYAFQKVT